ADEQRRAARSAALFTEEELTRFLQVMLRTFDELGYRQEQRFHFELGLLKLVHLQRLLPVEELLSRFPVSGSSGGTEPARPRPTASAPSTPVSRTSTSPVRAIAPETAAKPAFSPFADRSPRSFAEPVPMATRNLAVAPVEVPAQPAPVIAIREPEPAEITVTEVAVDLLGMADIPAAVLEREAMPATSEVQEESVPATSSSSAENLQRIAIEALGAARSQGSAADALADAEWTVAGDEIRVQTELSKTMLPMVINPEAEKLVRAALRGSEAGRLKLVLLPGAANAAAAKKPRAAKTGSVQAKAMDHPVVQQAQRLFNAEIRNVIDLRDND
ncbi:MAG TPA: hypothetical protein VK596_05470, partial [Edaphobacter sp.]|nr:hypothetical protein [Edaphobacter sp.]